MENNKSYNEEMAQLYNELGLTDYELRPLAEEEKSNPEDWAKMADNLALKDAESTEVARLSGVYAKEGSIIQKDGKEWITIAIIGHTESGKTTLMEAINKCLDARKETKKVESIKLIEINKPEQFRNLFDPRDKWPETIKLLEESIGVIEPHSDQERLTYPYTKEKFGHEINKITSNYEYSKKLTFKSKLYHQTRKKGR
ncbi:MAG: AAA family ATPase [Bacilli bacterium]|nr:AAA family ATPase [Bacilli bacterium]